jgi:6-phosphogluconolactonase/glucosamine-6-phosphate isomerase/deaminase
MTASLAVQYIVVALAVLASAWVVAVKQFPHATRRARIALALPLLRNARPRWLHVLGRRIAPATKAVDGACGSCDGCGSKPNP